MSVYKQTWEFNECETLSIHLRQADGAFTLLKCSYKFVQCLTKVGYNANDIQSRGGLLLEPALSYYELYILGVCGF